MRRSDRGVTFITVLMLLAAAFGFLWIFTFGEAYWENFEVKRVLTEAANLGYRETNDDRVKDFVFRELTRRFAVDDHGGPADEMRIDVDRGDLRVERIENPKFIRIWLTYSREVTIPLVRKQRRVIFNDYAEQDLTPVKW